MSESVAQANVINSLSGSAERLFAGVRRLPLQFWRGLVVVLALIWLVRSAATLFWLLFPMPELGQPPRLAMPVDTRAQGELRSVEYKSLASLADVFGSSVPVAVVEAPPTQQESEIANAETTKLRLKLHGIFATSEPSRGSAIIADGTKQILYTVGDDIEGNRGVKLSQVLDKRVILDNNGKPESLWLFSEEDFQVSARPSRRRPPPPTMDRAIPRENTIRTSARPEQIPKNIGDVVRFSVHREGGQMVGYRIRPGRDRELFNQVGLKANDIVTSVNGIEVNDPKQIRTVYKSMKTATQAQLTVLRDGDTHSITISLDSGE